MLVLVVRAITLPGAGEGLAFYLKPDFAKMKESGISNVVSAAMGQAFFTLSIGIGSMAIFGSYIDKDRSLMGESLSILVLDTAVALMSGFIIFPAAFSVGIQPDAGPSLIFITLPNVFQQAFGGVPFLATVFSLMFYVLLALAALTSTISLHEVVTAYLTERFNISRGRAAMMVTSFCVVTGVLSSLSLGVWDEKFFGLSFFDLLDFVTAKLMLPLSGLLVCLFVGWYLKRSVSYEELTNYGLQKAPYFSVYMFILKYLAPVVILLIFVNELGWLS
jgi:NSS family neurotransmitter:Na+ symporter